MVEFLKGGDMKSGWKTTEFWATTLTSLGALFGAIAGIVPGKWAAAIMVVSEAAYAISRGLAKKPA